MKITEHFSSEEFDSHDGFEYPPKWIESKLRPLCEALEKIRATLGGKAMTITSGYRSPEHNRKVGGAKNSQHMLGIACDIKVKGVPASKVAQKVRELIAEGKIPKGGVGEYSTFTHYDQRGFNARWKGK